MADGKFKKALREQIDKRKNTEDESRDQVLESLLTSVPNSDNVSLEVLEKVVLVLETVESFPEDIRNWTLDHLMAQDNRFDVDEERDDKDLSLSEAAKILGKTSRTLHNWLRNGKIKGEKRGSRWFFSQEEVMKKMK